MLAKLFEITTGLVKDTYNVTADAVEATYDEVTSIPDAISKGWNEGCLTSDDEHTQIQDSQPTEKSTLFQGGSKVA
jgi:hypothetical protein